MSVAALLGGTAAGCGTDTMRFADSPFGNPFSSRTADPVSTGSVVTSVATGKVQQRALSSSLPSSSALPSAGMSSVARGDVTGSIPAAAGASVLAAQPGVTGPAGWSGVGGTPVTIQQGESIKALSTRYGVPESAIRQANGISSDGVPTPGSQVVIPAYRHGSPAGKVVPAPASMTQTKPASTAPVAQQLATRRVEPTTLGQQARTQAQSQAQVNASMRTQAAAPAAAAVRARAGQPEIATQTPDVTNSIPRSSESRAASLRAVAKPATTQKTAAPTSDDDDDDAPAKVSPAPVKSAQARAAEPAAASDARSKVDAKAVKPDAKPDAKATVKAESKAEPQTTASVAADPKPASAEFRWPARGRIIQGFGSKGGQSNEGINIAVPAGTPVRAAEGGVVAYAGSELKHYGNLVLIRHNDGYVTAYAHNGDLNVKKGEAVKRGQQIARSGQSGNVSSPQLHFELRKGSTPIDPTPYLAN